MNCVLFELESNFLLPQREQFHVQLYSAVKWESIPNAKYNRHVQCVRC
jgi:hypothetical protein